MHSVSRLIGVTPGAARPAPPERAPRGPLKAWRAQVMGALARAGLDHALAWTDPYRTIDDFGDDTWAQAADCPCGAWVRIEWDGQSRWSASIDEPCSQRPDGRPER